MEKPSLYQRLSTVLECENAHDRAGFVGWAIVATINTHHPSAGLLLRNMQETDQHAMMAELLEVVSSALEVSEGIGDNDDASPAQFLRDIEDKIDEMFG